MAAEAGHISKIHFTAADTAATAAVALGANIASWAGSTLGSVDLGDEGSLVDGSVEIVFLKENTVIEPPLALARTEELNRRNAIDTITFEAINCTEDVFTLDSSFSVTSNVVTPATTITYYTVEIEVAGQGLWHMPKCIVSITDASIGTTEVGSVKFEVRPMGNDGGTSDLPGGWQYTQYVAA